MKILKYLGLIIICLTIGVNVNIAYASANDILNDALDDVDTNELDNYLKDNSDYFNEKNINIKDLVKLTINGDLKINILDYLKYQFSKEVGFFKEVLLTTINILIVCIVLTIINYFTEDIGKDSVSQLVVFFSILIVFILATKDINFIKDTLKEEYIKFDNITRNVNGFFLASMVTLGKIGLLQFFQSYSNYIIGITTRFVYNFTDIMTIVLIVIVLINNISKLVNAKLLYKFLKKFTLTIFVLYIFIVVINFSVQGYILYKTDNIFINSIKSLSPSSAPVIGNAVNNFFGLFVKSLLLIKDIVGFIIILFIYSTFGSSIIKLFIVFILYRATAAVSEPFNTNISNLLQELSDIMYIYFVCLMTPIIIITIYYSITINFLNNIFG
ncbi:hypothetical protein JYG23_05065 [Sedimentibacter sp. zth1]|uniref:stage III sporulation protein AE n=1 Tax=Sedimentibacter sp. zth1 TaxID=2816908 RepID=UPI001A93A3A5|nr:hypothetical protein [Sedimentibacter sp. zth1]QSX06822.1 hypothetical protein JYG23_05065 [Sedimentibacter sp. zth1]